WTRDEVIGRTTAELGVWVDPGQRSQGLATLRDGGSLRNLEARFRTKAGAEIVALANADVVVVDGRTCVITALTDISARVRAEDALRESERRFAQFFDANPLPMTIVRMGDGRTLDVNEAMVRQSGWAREEILGRTTPELNFWAVPDERQRLVT